MKYNIGIILESSKAFDIYYAATGRAPERVPDGANTFVTPFRLGDENGVERAALLVNQRGFPQTSEEAARGDETDGLSVAIAVDAPADEGERVLAGWIDEFLPRRKAVESGRRGGSSRSAAKAEAARRNGRKGGRPKKEE